MIAPPTTRFISWIGVTLLAAAIVGDLASGWLLDFIFLPFGNYLHPEWDPPANFLIPIHWLTSTLIALFITGILCLLFALFARLRRA